MSAHNIQLFSGSVEIPDDLRVVSLTVEDGLVELGANGAFANVGYVMNNPGGSNAAVYYDKISDQLRVVHTDFGAKEDPNTVTIKNEDITMNVSGNVEALYYHGDGSELTGLSSTLQDVTTNGASSDKKLTLTNATGIQASGNVLVTGNVTSGEFHGDAGWLSNVQIPLEEVIMNGNTTSNIVEFSNALAFVTTGNAGIQNVAPIGDLSIGANVVFDDDATDILTVRGNINCEVITIGSLVLGETGHTEGLQQITDTGNTTTNTVEFNNASTAFKTLKKAGIGIALPSSDAMLHVDGNLRLGGVADTPDNENVFVRAAGALNIIANHSNTDNATSNLVMQAGEINAASITLAGAVTDDDRQRIVFKTRETEALAIDEFGNANFVSNVIAGTGAKFIGDGSALTGIVAGAWTASNSNIYYEANVAIGTNSVTSGARLEVDGTLQLTNAATDVTMSAIVGSAGGWSQQAQLLHDSPDYDDHFGSGVAISSDGTYAVSGAPNDERYIAGNWVGRGSAHVHVRSGTTWSHQQKLLASDGADSDNFAFDVAINRDGTYIVAGSYKKNSEAGAAYVFTRSGTTWSQQQKIAPSGSGYLTRGGLRFDSDANTLVMGALKYNGWAGAAYVWTRSGTTWSQQQLITGSDTAASDNFGASADITADGNMVIVGAPYHDSPTNNEGAAYIFTRSGTTWSQQAKIQAGDKQASDNFGNSVAIDEDGTRAIIGGEAEDTSGSSAGAAYIFKRSGTSWSQEAKIQANDANANDYFGKDVDITDDGSTAIASASWKEAASDAAITYVGYLYVFTRSGTTWSQVDKLGPTSFSQYDYFSNCSRIARNGGYIIGGNANDDDPSKGGAGSSIIFLQGTAGPDRLNVNKGVTAQGDITATGNVTAYSDKRLKDDIKKIENALDKIEQLNGYTYTMKNTRYTGLIAQEVLPILPEAVSGSEETHYALAYGNMMGLIVEALKEMREKMRNIEAQL